MKRAMTLTTLPWPSANRSTCGVPIHSVMLMRKNMEERWRSQDGLLFKRGRTEKVHDFLGEKDEYVLLRLRYIGCHAKRDSGALLPASRRRNRTTWESAHFVKSDNARFL